MTRLYAIFLMSGVLFIMICGGFISSADEMRIMDDGSVKYIAPDGTEKIVSMEGKTPYGMEIKEERKVMRRRDFVVELVYSAKLSDDNMDKYLTPFFKELEEQIVRWMHNHQVSRKTVRVVISNCKFCKTGYCKRKNKREIEITRFYGDRQEGGISFSHQEVIVSKKHPELAAKAVEALFGK